MYWNRMNVFLPGQLSSAQKQSLSLTIGVPEGLSTVPYIRCVTQGQ